MEVYPTKHAVAAMLERHVTWAEILWVIANPEVQYKSNTGNHKNDNATIYQRGSLYVVVANNPVFDRHDTGKKYPLHAVITVGLRRVQTWRNSDVVNRIKDNLT